VYSFDESNQKYAGFCVINIDDDFNEKGKFLGSQESYRKMVFDDTFNTISK
jgi:hypothetical protein